MNVIEDLVFLVFECLGDIVNIVFFLIYLLFVLLYVLFKLKWCFIFRFFFVKVVKRFLLKIGEIRGFIFYYIKKIWCYIY